MINRIFVKWLCWVTLAIALFEYFGLHLLKAHLAGIF